MQVLRYAAAMESLALSLLPVFATALDLDENFFEEAFESPMFRLRLSHYPPASKDTDQYGIAPHTDTSFLTLLAQVGLVSHVSSQPRTQDQEGLVVSSPSGRWTRVPNCPGLLVVNTGELLRHRYYIYQYLSKTFFIIFVTSAQAVGQRLCLLNTSLCCQPLKAVKVQVIHWSDHNLALQVQPALLLQLLPNSRDEVPANVHIRVETPPLSPHLLPTVSGGGAGGVNSSAFR